MTVTGTKRVTVIHTLETIEVAHPPRRSSRDRSGWSVRWRRVHVAAPRNGPRRRGHVRGKGAETSRDTYIHLRKYFDPPHGELWSIGVAPSTHRQLRGPDARRRRCVVRSEGGGP